jgi:2,3-bisphosphoglycerate-independent phosphoglycerate mutase
VAVRMNFVTADKDGVILDRRAGRMKTEESAELCKLLDGMSIKGVDIVVKPVMDYRAVIIMKGADLGDSVTDSDPQRNGIRPREIKALYPEAEDIRTAEIANEFVQRVQRILKGRIPANTVVLRGFARYQRFPSMYEVYNLKAASIATYPMYKGVTRLIGMDILPTGDSLIDELNTLAENFDKYNFFYLHVKKADSAGEDGDFDRKVKVLEEVDKDIPFLMELKPDVVVVTGDHSTPSVLRSHSWHPVPLMIYSKWCRPDHIKRFSERDCSNGGLGRILAKQVMPIVMANALKLNKYGA